jgi:hypothetical protein
MVKKEILDYKVQLVWLVFEVPLDLPDALELKENPEMSIWTSIL